mmetsp:Transcript_136023/g.235468  ORF Transcript_136023/g.235468 Transcript_136023/m.235468 type:complete len:169 (+) Transcript_136023:2-508(+)
MSSRRALPRTQAPNSARPASRHRSCHARRSHHHGNRARCRPESAHPVTSLSPRHLSARAGSVLVPAHELAQLKTENVLLKRRLAVQELGGKVEAPVLTSDVAEDELQRKAATLDERASAQEKQFGEEQEGSGLNMEQAHLEELAPKADGEQHLSSTGPTMASTSFTAT